VIKDPPLEEEAVQLTVTDVEEVTTAMAPVGAEGGPIGVAELDGDEATLVPAALVAVTVKV
jgi:hypothetical protein